MFLRFSRRFFYAPVLILNRSGRLLLIMRKHPFSHFLNKIIFILSCDVIHSFHRFIRIILCHFQHLPLNYVALHRIIRFLSGISFFPDEQPGSVPVQTAFCEPLPSASHKPPAGYETGLPSWSVHIYIRLFRWQGQVKALQTGNLCCIIKSL